MIAFSNAFLVIISRVVIPKRIKLTTASPAAYASSSLLESIAGADALPGNAIPKASATELIVFAVNIPPQAPSPGQAAFSISPNSDSVIFPRAQAPTPSKTSCIVKSLPFKLPGIIEPL